MSDFKCVVEEKWEWEVDYGTFVIDYVHDAIHLYALDFYPKKEVLQYCAEHHKRDGYMRLAECVDVDEYDEFIHKTAPSVADVVYLKMCLELAGHPELW